MALTFKLLLLTALIVLATCTSKPGRGHRKPCRVGKRWIAHGASFKRACNVCTCYSGKVSCKETKPCKTTCTYNGKTIANGASFKKDCNTCRCRNGMIGCSLYPCSCSYNGKKLSVGATVSEGCKDCTCRATGAVVCSSARCNCRVGKKTIKDGSSYKKQCNKCTCKEGKVTCSEDKCCRRGKSYVKAGYKFSKGCVSCQCMKSGKISCNREKCGDCKVGKKVMRNGSSYKKQCNTCTCKDGKVSCTEYSCCRRLLKYYKAGQKMSVGCAVCQCMKNGKIVCNRDRCRGCRVGKNWYKIGATFKQGRCRVCRCVAGKGKGSGRVSCGPAYCKKG